MHTEVLVIDPGQPRPESIHRAAAVLRGGGLVAFPTETVYGLGGNALDQAAVARIFAAKGRPANNPLIVHIASAAAARELAGDWPAKAEALARRFWPGPLTLILPRPPIIPDAVTAGAATVALRVPAHPVALALLAAANLPVAAPSANLSSGISPTLAEHVLRALDGRIDLILDAGPTQGGLESTVLDLTTTPPRLLRPGLVSPGEIESVIGPIHLARQQTELPASFAMPSPGMLRRHYAPRTPLECIAGDSGPRVEELCKQGLRVGWVRFEPMLEKRLPGLVVACLPAEPAAAAARLYAVLHELDEASLDRIVVELPPASDEWLAVRDRLNRAMTPNE
jgi:L-threonylcarbamoyladenylate synthase